MPSSEALAAIAGAALLVALVFALRHRRARRVYLGALLEQVRRENEHEGPEYRHDQRVRAIQQRLSRRWGRRAFTEKTRARIEKDLQ